MENVISRVDVVRTIYGAFARGDVPTVLAQLTPDVEWEYGADDTDVPWLQPRHGRGAVPAFFAAFGGATDLLRFDVKELLEGVDVVIAIIDIEFAVPATGTVVIEEDQIHIWQFTGSHVSRFRHRCDTHQHLRAFQT
ncbi:MAG: nuclear transport factor 2 family protein [bacterium]